MRVWEGLCVWGGIRLNCHSASGGITEEFCAVQLSWYELGPPIRGEKWSEREADYLSPYKAIIKRCEPYILFTICFYDAVPNTWLTLFSRYIVREINENRYVLTSKTSRGKAKLMQNDGRKIANEQAIY
jgi:hypothetical protein